MLNRSKIVIDVEPFIFAQTFRIQVMQQSRMPYRVAVKRPRQLSAANVGGTPRRTAPFPKGDVRQPQTAVRLEVPAKPLEVHRSRTVTGPARFADAENSGVTQPLQRRSTAVTGFRFCRVGHHCSGRTREKTGVGM
jgi:hypothetical protein